MNVWWIGGWEKIGVYVGVNGIDYVIVVGVVVVVVILVVDYVGNCVGGLML